MHLSIARRGQQPARLSHRAGEPLPQRRRPSDPTDLHLYDISADRYRDRFTRWLADCGATTTDVDTFAGPPARSLALIPRAMPHADRVDTQTVTIVGPCFGTLADTGDWTRATKGSSPGAHVGRPAHRNAPAESTPRPAKPAVVSCVRRTRCGCQRPPDHRGQGGAERADTQRVHRREPGQP